MRHRMAWVLVLALFALGLPPPAQAQEWPQRPVRIIVPFPAGGNSDAVARIIAQRLGEVFGQQFVVESRPGAGGALAAESVARAPADGYTLFMATLGQIAVIPKISKAPYDPVRDLVPISNIGTNPFVLVINASVPATNLKEFVDYVRRQPDKLTYVSAGPGSMVHLSMALFLNRAGIDMIPVSYKGGAAPLTDVVAGHVTSFFPNLSVVLPQAGTGTIRMLAVSSEQRNAQLPDVPTFIESGFPGFHVLTWNGLMAPAGTPKDIIDRLAQEVGKAVRDPSIAERLVRNGVDPLGNSPAEFAAMIAHDMALWDEAIKAADTQPK
ncbi:MAG TPA: tripartite tricarboxylate transporter substrate binding protein [Xanthobacteraceae bacterium]|nr:tripartite tricarboxylate transporter substrate binding protein [Xanthobacteraceae bacterium]